MLNAAFKILYPFKTKKKWNFTHFYFFVDVCCKSASRDIKKVLEIKHVNIVISNLKIFKKRTSQIL